MGCTWPNIDVDCDNWNGTAGGSFTFVNNLSVVANITQDGTNPWPFTGCSAGMSIPVGQNGSCSCGTSGGSYKVNGNVKHVIITARRHEKH